MRSHTGWTLPMALLLAFGMSWAQDKASAGHADEGKKVDCFFVGCSLLDGCRVQDGLRPLAATRGHTLSGNKKWREFAMSGAGVGISHHWYHKANDKPSIYESYFPILTGQKWDAICLQPFQAGPLLKTITRVPHYYPQKNATLRLPPPLPSGDVYLIGQYIDHMVRQGKSPDLDVIVYSHWPQLGKGKTPFQEKWDHPYDERHPDNGHRRVRDCFEQMVEMLNARNHGRLLHKPVRMAPIGDVMYEVDRRLREKPRKGQGDIVYTNIWDLFGDNTHLKTGAGRYLTAMALYATLYKESPVGLPLGAYNEPKTYHAKYAPNMEKITPELAEFFQQTAWDVISTHPYAGIAPPQEPMGIGSACVEFEATVIESKAKIFEENGQIVVKRLPVTAEAITAHAAKSKSLKDGKTVWYNPGQRLAMDIISSWIAADGDKTEIQPTVLKVDRYVTLLSDAEWAPVEAFKSGDKVTVRCQANKLDPAGCYPVFIRRK